MQARLFEFLQEKSASLLLCEDSKEADLLADVCEFLGFKSFILPDFRAEQGDDLRAFLKELFSISEILYSYHNYEDKKILISPIKTVLHKLPGKKHLKPLTLNKKDKFDLQSFKQELLLMGYDFVDIVQDKAELSIRNDIIDIFSVNEQNPIRILFFEDEIESIRYFDINTQKSLQTELDRINICPFLAHFSQDEYESVQDRLKEKDTDVLLNDFVSLGLWCIDDLCDYLELDYYAIKDLQEFDVKDKIIGEAKHFKSLELSSFTRDFFLLNKDKNITVLARNESLVDELNLKEFSNIKYVNSNLVLNIGSAKELIVSLNKKYKAKKAKKASIIIDELSIGDFVVHEDYGIGKFLGLEMIEISGVKKDFVSIAYQGDDKLLLPVENLHLIDKYIASSSSIPILDKLGKGTFVKLKERLKAKLFAIASSIVEMAAKRALIRAKDVRSDEKEELAFIKSANFTYTSDQLKVCEDIRADFKSSKVMDRLLSGDVGFGKTEVAMNAIFTVVKSGYCALFFVPTTLLSQQHYKNLKKRLQAFDIEVLKLDRFTSAKEKKYIAEKLAKNDAFVLVGTHALLNVKCDNLALVVIDEEHKFGVKQKEKLKEFSQNAHILSMSATPIPRSLNQALSSIKSYSTLQTPPNDRLDVRTFVKEKNESLIKEAILRELRRAGQIFYIHNHIASIQSCKKDLLELFPNLRILILHSKIDAKSTEEEMLKFEDKQYDLLLCTSIVESGIDLPNVNTIIVEQANRFGIADLHQLRGRVGRSDRQGYCYFLIDDKKSLKEDALKRLASLESNSFLGAGSILAYHDLEIRGGGNLLGVDQSGHIEQIGYSLYIKMLEDEINALSKGKDVELSKVDLKLNINAFLNEDLISEDRLRLELYRRLSKCELVSDVYEIAGEIEDRFGKLDKFTKNFLDLIIIKILAKDRYLLISSYDDNIQFVDMNSQKIVLKAKSKDDGDVLAFILEKLRNERGLNGLAKV
ncbi:transcription-repair coupling factor [Campylobacter avium LMG 24591]|uniref:Transcription-repair-coupling factor n=1 Tax=Campylobacter avium LMG 24591 TaxID=522484 RepID=A0A222MXN0_9BACT|nr:DEAD/DEAH box helicase [Campylobacter avium]ASQ30450.1 transcription-repair coupling factor [Campylobacter avium LMG 24591]OYD79547.1 transcription-repair coupling factor [Campylobacter avium]